MPVVQFSIASDRLTAGPCRWPGPIACALTLGLAAAFSIAMPHDALAQAAVDGLRGPVGESSILPLLPGTPLAGTGTGTPAGGQSQPLIASPAPSQEAVDPSEVPPSRRGPSSGLPSPSTGGGPDPFAVTGSIRPADPDETNARDELRTGTPQTGRVLPAGPVPPVQTGSGGPPDDNPYAAVGIRVGTFVLRPTLDVGLTAVSRRGFQENGDEPPGIVETDEDGIFSETELRLVAESDWNRHALTIEASGTWQENISGDLEAEPSADISATGRIDISAETTLTASAGYSFTAEDVVASELVTTEADGTVTRTTVASGNPGQQTIDGRLTLEHDTGGWFAAISGGIERTDSRSLDLDDGTSVARNDPDNTLYDASLRAGFALSPVFRPFAEIELAQRVNDQEIDSDGFARDSLRTTARLGTEIDLGEKLSGELAIGYLLEDLEDDRLDDIEGVSLAGQLNWSPRRGTDVALNLGTSTQPSGRDGVSGSISYEADLALTQRIRRNLDANLGLSVEREVFTGPAADTTTLSATAGLEYWFNRYVGLVGDYTHERVTGGEKTDEQTTDTVFVGLRFQR